MRITVATGLCFGLALAVTNQDAHAQAASSGGDRYCDFVQGVASAQSALLFGPELFGTFGYLDQQQQTVDIPEGTSDDLRLTAGVRYSLGNAYEGLLTRGRASAECQRYRALGQVQGATEYAALSARAKVLDEALREAQSLLDEANGELQGRRSTAQEVMGTKLRVDELRALAAATRRQLDALPAPAKDESMSRALASFQAADAAVERHEARLRRAQAWDVSVRVGYDAFLTNDADDSPFFALVQGSFNLGWLLQGSGNDRAARGRRALVDQGRIGGADEATAASLRATLTVEQRREEETGVLLADLQQQLDSLKAIGGDNSRRYRQTVWFEWVKIKAEHEYLAAHVASLREVLGEPVSTSDKDEP